MPGKPTENYLRRNDYIHYIWIYQQRRSAIRNKHGWTRKGPNPVAYHDEVYNIQKKISYWQMCVRRLDKKPKYRKMFRRLYKLTEEFIGKKIDLRTQKRDMVLIKFSLYKYALDNDIPNREIVAFCRVRKDAASVGRTTLINSFPAYPQKREFYYRYKQYMDSQLKVVA